MILMTNRRVPVVAFVVAAAALLAAVAVIIQPSPASALVTATPSKTVQLSAGQSAPLGLASFDGSLGELDSAKLTLTIAVDAGFGIENVGPLAVYGSYEWDSRIEISTPSGTESTPIYHVGSDGLLSAFDGELDYVGISGRTASTSSSGTSIQIDLDAAALSSLVGDGTSPASGLAISLVADEQVDFPTRRR